MKLRFYLGDWVVPEGPDSLLVAPIVFSAEERLDQLRQIAELAAE